MILRLNKIAVSALLALVFLAAATARPAFAPRQNSDKPAAPAKALYAAWKNNNRAAAARVASAAVVKKLFKNKWTGPDWQFQGCDDHKSYAICSYYYEGGGASMRVAKRGTSYTVTSLSFIVD